MADSKEGSGVVDVDTTKGADKDITKQESRMNLVVGIFTAVIPVFALLKRLKVIPKDSPILVVVSLSVE